MYGLVIRAAQELIVEGFGVATWERIKRDAGIDIDEFLSQEHYDDALTFQLVAATSNITGLTAAQVLEALGQYWIQYTGREGYGPVLDLAGNTLPELLQNLDRLHARVDAVMPKARMPQFRAYPIDDQNIRLEYRSERVGLAPMVVGLLRGLSERFGLEIDVEQIMHRGPSADHDEFLIHYRAQQR